MRGQRRRQRDQLMLCYVCVTCIYNLLIKTMSLDIVVSFTLIEAINAINFISRQLF